MWKDIPGYEGLYKINECGDVFSIKYNKIKARRMPDQNYLYPYILLYKDGKQKKIGIHQLVAMAFIPNSDNLPVVMHLDNNKYNCHISNLKWGTYEENRQDAVNDGLLNKRNNYNYYQIYDEERKIYENCEGYRQVIEKVGYGTKSMFRYALHNNSKFKDGPYKGCKLRRAVKGITYEPIKGIIYDR